MFHGVGMSSKLHIICFTRTSSPTQIERYYAFQITRIYSSLVFVFFFSRLRPLKVPQHDRCSAYSMKIHNCGISYSNAASQRLLHPAAGCSIFGVDSRSTWSFRRRCTYRETTTSSPGVSRPSAVSRTSSCSWTGCRTLMLSSPGFLLLVATSVSVLL